MLVPYLRRSDGIHTAAAGGCEVPDEPGRPDLGSPGGCRGLGGGGGRRGLERGDAAWGRGSSRGPLEVGRRGGGGRGGGGGGPAARGGGAAGAGGGGGGGGRPRGARTT